MVLRVFGIFLSIFLLGGCSNPIFEFPNLDTETEIEVSEFRIVTYNIHGGKGPNGEGNLRDNLVTFNAHLQGEEIVCFQEVVPDCWNDVKSIFSDYPHRYFLPQVSTKFGTNKQGGNAIFSKFPIQSFDQRLIQCDPGGDKWERRAQYVRVYIGNEHQYLNIFHYHNTYNWHENNSESEKSGMEEFVAYAESNSFPESEMTILLGDFNLRENQVNGIVNTQFYSNSSSNWVDHIYTNSTIINAGFYDTRGAKLSDHQAVWAVICNEDC